MRLGPQPGPGGGGEKYLPKRGMRQKGRHTYLVTSGPPILSGSSVTLQEGWGDECLLWT